ncbi:hypothetical protein MARA_18490 [Mycolicibacterium arabiense]|uniref:Uncharacterized protein n=1 Tax=Mycolicibacterium arabiense TaxID=1286181 RepID=A0A7I7RW33_9MYCO|nr:hypothetical protein MARA_18490 [Mycolicibacterium arabiense]
MTGFDKFGWLKALHSDAALTDKDLRLAVVIGVTYTRSDGSGWAVDLDALSAALPGGLSRRRLTDALGRLVNLGYLAETGRSGGGRGVTARRSFDLRKPPTPASGVSRQTPDSTVGGLADPGLWITAETHDASGTGLAETQDASVRNPGRQRPKPLTPASEIVASDLRERPPTGTSTGTPTGGEAAGSRQAAVPPPSSSLPANGKPTYHPRCAKHIHDETAPGCYGCKEAREAAEASAQTAEEREAERRGQIRDAIDSCRHCDPWARLDDLTDCPHHENFRTRQSA